MTAGKNDKQFIAHFKGKKYFTKEDLNSYFESTGDTMTDGALRIRIHKWKKKGIIRSIARGKYEIKTKPQFEPQIDSLIKKLNKTFLSVYTEFDYCIWSTKYLHNLMLHIPSNSFYIFETEKEICEEVFYMFKDKGINAYYMPDQDQIDKYVLQEEKSVIVKPIISRAPYELINNIRLASIEKILVDLFCDTDIYYVYGSSDLHVIIENVFNMYTMNYSKFKNYANRRNRSIKIKDLLTDNIQNLINDLWI